MRSIAKARKPKEDKSKGKGKGKKVVEEEFDQTFAIIPEDVTLLAKSGIMF